MQLGNFKLCKNSKKVEVGRAYGLQIFDLLEKYGLIHG